MKKFLFIKSVLTIIPYFFFIIIFLLICFFVYKKNEKNIILENNAEINIRVIDSSLVKINSKIFKSIDKIKNEGIEKIKIEITEYDKNLRFLILKYRDESLSKYERNKFKIKLEEETKKIEKIIIEKRQALKEYVTKKMSEVEMEFKKTIEDYAVSHNISIIFNRKINEIQSIFFIKKNIDITDEIIKLFDKKFDLFQFNFD